MRWLRRFSGHKRESDLDREIRAHLDLEAEEQQDAGVAAEDARYAAQRAFGNPTLIKEDVRAAWGWTSVETWLQDLRYGLRLLRRNPGFTLFSVASLGLGIGATVAVFSLFDAIVLRTLPVRDPERLVVASFGGIGPAGPRYNYSLSYPQFVADARPQRLARGALCGLPDGQGQRHPSRRTGRRAGVARHRRLLRRAGDQAVAGPLDHGGRRSSREPRRGPEPYAYWQRRFGGRPEILGAAIALNNVPFTIVGVEPPGFFGTEVGRPPDISIPMRTRDLLSEEDPLWNAASASWIYVMGRLKPGVSLDQAAQELNAIYRQASAGRRALAERGTAGARIEPEARAGRHGGRQRFARRLCALAASAVEPARRGPAARQPERRDAAALTVRGEAERDRDTTRARRRALADRPAVPHRVDAVGRDRRRGRSRAVLVGQPGAAPHRDVGRGSPAPGSGARTFASWPSPIALSAGMCVLFGLIPAWRATSPSRPIRTTRQIGGGRRRRVVDRALVACQVAISLGLLAVGGLFLRSLGNIWAQDTGYNRNGVVMFSVDARLAGKRGPDVPAHVPAAARRVAGRCPAPGR